MSECLDPGYMTCFVIRYLPYYEVLTICNLTTIRRIETAPF